MTTAQAQSARGVLAPQWLRAKAGAASARAKRALLIAAGAAIDSGIASLQRLRQCVRGPEPEDERRDHQRRRPAKRAATERPGGELAAEPSVAPKPRRRLRALLVYVSVMLAGGMLGMALAYDLLAQLLDRRSALILRQEVKIAGDSKSIAGWQARLEQQQAKQTEAEARLATVLAENDKRLAESQAQRVESGTRPAAALAGGAGNPLRQEDASRGRGAARSTQAAWTKSGNCTLGGGDIRAVLNGCIADMNRK